MLVNGHSETYRSMLRTHSQKGSGAARAMADTSKMSLTVIINGSFVGIEKPPQRLAAGVRLDAFLEVLQLDAVKDVKPMKSLASVPRKGVKGGGGLKTSSVLVYRAAGTLGVRAPAASLRRSRMRLEREIPDNGMLPLWLTLK